MYYIEMPNKEIKSFKEVVNISPIEAACCNNAYIYKFHVTVINGFNSVSYLKFELHSEVKVDIYRDKFIKIIEKSLI